MGLLQCPKCGSDDVELHMEFDGLTEKLIEQETNGKCNQCGRKFSFKEIKTAIEKATGKQV